MIKFWMNKQYCFVVRSVYREFPDRLDAYQMTANNQYVNLVNSIRINDIKVDKTLLNQGFKL